MNFYEFSRRLIRNTLNLGVISFGTYCGYEGSRKISEFFLKKFYSEKDASSAEQVRTPSQVFGTIGAIVIGYITLSRIYNVSIDILLKK